MRPRVQQGSTMIAEPRWFYDEPTNTMVINLINITSTNIMAKEGIGTVQMSLVGASNITMYLLKTSTLSGNQIGLLHSRCSEWGTGLFGCLG